MRNVLSSERGGASSPKLAPGDSALALVEVLDLTARTYYNLKRRNITTVRQVLLLPKQDLLEIVQLTPENFAELRERLIACGFLSPTHLIGPFAEEDSDQDSGT